MASSGVRRIVPPATPTMSPRAQQLIGNTLRYSRIELVLLWIVVFMMVVKLGT